MRDRNVRPFGSKILYTLVWNGWIKDNNLLLNTEIDSEFLMLRSKSNLTIRVEGKKRELETICSTAEDGYTVVPCSGVCFTFWN